MFYQLKIILRNLRHNLSYSVINIAGLTIGITASIFIFLWVHHEHSFDKYHADADRIYSITNTWDLGEGNRRELILSPYILVSAVKDIPEIEDTAVLLQGYINGIKVGNEVFSVTDQVVYVNDAWFALFDYQLLEGSFSAFGNHPYSVALAESEARRYFGNSPAVGQTVEMQGVDYMVQAVVKDHPDNSSFQWKVMASMDAYLSDPSNQEQLDNWFNLQWVIFVKLRLGADIPAVSQKIGDIFLNNAAQGKGMTFSKASLKLLTDIHFETDIPDSLFVHENSKTVLLFNILGVFLLLMACINYVNLATARADMRTKEVGIKKIVGAKRRVLFMQFIAESFLICLIAALASLALIWLLSPYYHFLIENSVLSFSSPVIWIILGIILFATTLLNGIYPALMLSSFRPMNFLKRMSVLKIKDSHLRKGLVVFQFTLSITLMVSVMILYKQMQYIRQMNPGYDREQVISLKSPSTSGDHTASLQSMKNELLSRATIVGATLCSNDITNARFATGGADWDGRAEDLRPRITVMGVDADYMQTFGLELVEGRWFEDGSIADETNVVLNETAIREFNIREPYIGQRFDILGMKGRIIGVVKDFHYRSLHEKIGNIVLVNKWHSMIAFKMKAGQSSQAIQAAEEIWGGFFPNDPFEYTFLDDTFNSLYKSDVKTSRLMLLFSVLAIVIALLGLFGLSTFAVERRTKEIGIRKVLGASVGNIVSMLSKEFLILVGVAMLIAFPLAYYWADRILQDFAYHISIGWWIFAAAGIITIMLTLITVGWQAIKAATANPVKAIMSGE